MDWTPLWPLLIGLCGSYGLEGLLRPGAVAFWKRPAATHCLHAGLWLLIFAGLLLAVQRPWFAMAVAWALTLLVVLVSNAKYHSLREPFIFQDFEYFSDAIKHPRLYLPFLGWGNALLAVAAFVVALFLGLSLETSLLATLGIGGLASYCLAMALAAGCLLWLGNKAALAVDFQPESDLWRLGLAASLWRYGEAELKVERKAGLFDKLLDQPAQLQARPNLVVVQSESFFDARDAFPGINPQVLANFDQAKADSVCFGKLDVPAWGANTVRSEFAFLSGMNLPELGVHAFNPYRKWAQRPLATLASYLKGLGYRTVCVHPYPASFYARDKVYPLLGFDEFIDIRQFGGVEKTGPYIGDVQVAEKVGQLLQANSSQPLFIFVITMENHGPLHLEKVKPAEIADLHTQPPASGCDDLTIYLRHLRNADRMCRLLQEQLAALPGQHGLCWYGDHVPIMAEVYKTLGAPQGQTDYLLWKSGDFSGEAQRKDVAVQDLAAMLLTEFGLA